MRRYQQGAYVRVTVSASEVQAFARRWPCADLPDRGVSFTFARNGDLVDVFPESLDGSAALALSQDAWAYACADGRGCLVQGLYGKDGSK